MPKFSSHRAITLIKPAYVRFFGIHLWAILQRVHATFLYNEFKNYTLKLIPYIPVANELIGLPVTLFCSPKALLLPSNNVLPVWLILIETTKFFALQKSKLPVLPK